jgi:hypothetical protein
VLADKCTEPGKNAKQLKSITCKFVNNRKYFVLPTVLAQILKRNFPTKTALQNLNTGLLTPKNIYRQSLHSPHRQEFCRGIGYGLVWGANQRLRASQVCFYIYLVIAKEQIPYYIFTARSLYTANV